MKKSAGILPYKIEDNELKVYLEHPGGPFWAGKDKWSICKGEYSEEPAIKAAIREFREESGFLIEEESLEFLGSQKLNSTNKLITIFIVKKDLDATKMKSNTFEMEYPFGSGKISSYPEMDEGRWFTISEAKTKILKGQDRILDKLEDRYNNGYLK